MAVSLPVAVAATNATAVQQETAPTPAASEPAAVEASLGLDRPAPRRLTKQGLPNEVFGRGVPDRPFGPHTRAPITRASNSASQMWPRISPAGQRRSDSVKQYPALRVAGQGKSAKTLRQISSQLEGTVESDNRLSRRGIR